MILEPKENQTVSDIVSFHWTKAEDTKKHPLHYSISYNIDGGDSWILIQENITNTSFNWDISSIPFDPNNITIKIIASDDFGFTNSIAFLRTINIVATRNNDELFTQYIFSLVLLTLLFTLFYFYFLKNRNNFFGNQHADDVFSLKKADFVRQILNKIIIGLENCKTTILEIPPGYPISAEVDDNYGITNYFPIEYQTDLNSKIKGRTILVLIELAFLYPDNANPTKISQILSIPKSSLSDELNKLSELGYIESKIDMKVLSDSRYKSYTLSQKGYNFLFRLKDILKISLDKAEFSN